MPPPHEALTLIDRVAFHHRDGMQMFNGKRILIAETDFVNATIVQLLFERHGGEVEITECADTAITLAGSGRFDLIILENRLHGLPGMQASRRIRDLPGEASATPILLVTTDVVRLHVTSCMDNGIDAIVAKPFDLNEFLRKARQIMASPRIDCGAA